jgi:hypothetical protein
LQLSGRIAFAFRQRAKQSHGSIPGRWFGDEDLKLDVIQAGFDE